jgi:hypothetical protein
MAWHHENIAAPQVEVPLSTNSQKEPAAEPRSQLGYLVQLCVAPIAGVDITPDVQLLPYSFNQYSLSICYLNRCQSYSHEQSSRSSRGAEVVRGGKGMNRQCVGWEEL